MLTLIIDFVKLIFVTFVVHVFTTNVSVSKWVFMSILHLISVSKVSVNYGIGGTLVIYGVCAYGDRVAEAFEI